MIVEHLGFLCCGFGVEASENFAHKALQEDPYHL